MKKVLSRQRLAAAVASLRRKKKRIAFTNGCFDILHRGHVAYLAKARACADVLILGLNSDASVRRLKGPNRPLVRQQDRAAVLAALSSVDFVTIFSEDTPERVIRLIRPDVLVKGADWAGNVAGSDVVRSYGGRVKLIRLVKGRSTSSLIERILKVYGKKR